MVESTLQYLVLLVLVLFVPCGNKEGFSLSASTAIDNREQLIEY